MTQNEKLNTNKTEIKQLNKWVLDNREDLQNAQIELEECKSQLSKLEQTMRTKSEESLKARNRISKLIIENESLEKEIKLSEIEDKATQLLRQEPSFWDALEIRINHLNQTNGENAYSKLDSLQPTEEIIKKFKDYAHNPKNMSDYAIMLKSAENSYVEYQKSLCKKKVNGETITVEDKQGRIQLLDRILHKPEISAFWN